MVRWQIGRAQTPEELEVLRALALGGETENARQVKINNIKAIVNQSGAATLAELMYEIDARVRFARSSRTQGYYSRHLDHHWVLTFAEARDRGRTLVIYLFQSNHGWNNQNVQQYNEILNHLHVRLDGGNQGYRLVGS